MLAWYRFREDYKPIPNNKPPVGKALTEEEQARLFEVAQSREDWMYAHAAATLAFYCGMRACEIKGLRWQHVDRSDAGEVIYPDCYVCGSTMQDIPQ